MRRNLFILKIFLIPVLLLWAAGCATNTEVRDDINTGPRVYHSDYNKVWSAALDALDESGYVVLQMNKDDGFIATDFKEDTRWRGKVSMRLTKLDASVVVSVNLYSESLETLYSPSGNRTYWRKRGRSWLFENMLLDKIASRL